MRRLLLTTLLLLPPVWAWSTDANDGLTELHAHLAASDHARALPAAFLATESRNRATREAAWFAVGWLRREAGEPALAAVAFARSGGDLAPLARWYEAEQLLADRQPTATVDRCERYRSNWPEGEHAFDCLRVIALAQAERGRPIAALAAAAAYDEEHPWGRITETVELRLAMTEYAAEPLSAVPRLRRLAVHHTTPLAGRIAEETLGAMVAAGQLDYAVPDDTPSLIARATSLRDTRRSDLAWAMYQQVAARAETDLTARAWVEKQAEPFGWRTRHWKELLARNEGQYRLNPSAATAWDVFRVAVRGAQRARAASIAKEMLAKWPGASEWRWNGEELGRSLLLIGQYAAARDFLDTVAQRGGSLGKRARLAAGFAALQAGDATGAIERLTPLAEAGEVEALYWRARAHRKLGHGRDASADREAIATRDPHGWYATWLRSEAPLLPRTGGWPPSQPAIVDFAPLTATTEPAWEGVLLPRHDQLSMVSESVLRVSDDLPPPGYPVAGFADLEAARTYLGETAAKYAATWPELRQIATLVDLGLYDLSGPMLSAAHQERTDSLRGKGRHALESRQWTPTPEAWRGLFLLARDHHHTAKSTWGLWNHAPPELEDAAWQLAYPLAHDRAVWTASRASNVDPFLVMGLMRQESTYNAIARSRVGARGAMQIMPRTGHLMADLAHDMNFSAGDLEDPTYAVDMGIDYLSLLQQRFEGVPPLAIASYNAGPFNVSGWLSNTGADMPLDAWVEHIPYKETREYVKKVTAGWSAYVAIYGEREAGVVLPPTPAGDRIEIVDF